MSRDGSGTYTLPVNSFAEPVASTIISPTDAAATLNDLATELTDSLSRSGKGSMSAALDLNNHDLNNAKTVVFKGSSSGSTTMLATAAAGSTTLTLPAATDTLTGKATTDTLTNKTFDTAGTGNVFKINGVGISANTGTGSNVLATSPTLTTPALGVATATSINGVTIDNNAWTAYTPTVSSGGGTITTSSVTGRYKLIGKTCFVTIDIIITNAGTGSGALKATLPFTAASNYYTGSSRDIGGSGKSGASIIMSAAPTIVQCSDSVNASYITTTEVAMNITYEIA